MKFKATIHIMPRPEILDPQGKATLHGLHNLGFAQVEAVRIGKQVEVTVEAENAQAAKTTLEDACKKLLANPVIEQYHFDLTEI